MDDYVEAAPVAVRVGWPAWRLGFVLPKKQARRAVTRSLIRHQGRAALCRHAEGLNAHVDDPAVEGWVVRLRAPFDRKHFVSAASGALKAAVRAELDELWRRVSAPRRPRPASQEGGTPPVKGVKVSDTAHPSPTEGGKPPGAGA